MSGGAAGGGGGFGTQTQVYGLTSPSPRSSYRPVGGHRGRRRGSHRQRWGVRFRAGGIDAGSVVIRRGPVGRSRQVGDGGRRHDHDRRQHRDEAVPTEGMMPNAGFRRLPGGGNRPRPRRPADRRGDRRGSPHVRRDPSPRPPRSGDQRQPDGGNRTDEESQALHGYLLSTSRPSNEWARRVVGALWRAARARGPRPRRRGGAPRLPPRAQLGRTCLLCLGRPALLGGRRPPVHAGAQLLGGRQA